MEKYQNKIKTITIVHLKYAYKAVVGVAQWIEHRPASEGVSSSIPSQGTCLRCRPGPWGGGEAVPH